MTENIEKELVKATKIKAATYPNRQDFLASVARALDKMKADAFDLLSDEAAEWSNIAINAIREKEIIPDFDGSLETGIALSEEGEMELPDPKDKAEEAAEKPKKKTKKTSEKKPNEIKYTALSGEKNRYGVVKGTKTAQAIEMYERGATGKEIKDTLQGRFYNILKTLSDQGHKVEKGEGGIWKLTHKDDVK